MTINAPSLSALKHLKPVVESIEVRWYTPGVAFPADFRPSCAGPAIFRRHRPGFTAPG